MPITKMSDVGVKHDRHAGHSVGMFRELASLITIMVLGHWLEILAISQARGALNALAALLPDTAERVNGTEAQTVPISELKVGDVVLVRPRACVPAHGVCAGFWVSLARSCRPCCSNSFLRGGSVGETGGPLKPGFGLSGPVPLEKLCFTSRQNRAIFGKVGLVGHFPPPLCLDRMDTRRATTPRSTDHFFATSLSGALLPIARA